MPAILVTGATGKQGGAVINALLNQTQDTAPILAVTRTVASDSAQRLAAKSPRIKLVQGNLDDVPALFQAAEKVCHEPIWGVFSVQVSMGPGVTVDGEVAQGKALIDASIEAGVQHFVYSSVERGGDAASWDSPTPIPHFQSKYHVERYLRDATKDTTASPMGWTILRPVAFMDNLAPGIPTKVFLTAMQNHLGRDGKTCQWIATSDIGVFAAKAFAKPRDWNRRAVGIAGDELTFEQLSRAFAKATGQPAPTTYWFFGSALTYVARELGVMLQWFASHGYKADIQARRNEHPGLLTMEQWLVRASKFAQLRANLTADNHIVGL